MGWSAVEEHFYECPYCGERISSLLDFSLDAQCYIEDCEVCCRPIELAFEVDGSALCAFVARSLDA